MRIESLSEPAYEPVRASVMIRHPHGLHLRVGKDLVQLANCYQARIAVCNLTRHSPEVDAKSILQLMQLQARQGHTIQLAAAGPDAQEAIVALCGLLETLNGASA